MAWCSRIRVEGLGIGVLGGWVSISWLVGCWATQKLDKFWHPLWKHSGYHTRETLDNNNARESTGLRRDILLNGCPKPTPFYTIEKIVLIYPYLFGSSPYYFSQKLHGFSLRPLDGAFFRALLLGLSASMGLQILMAQHLFGEKGEMVQTMFVRFLFAVVFS